MHSISRIVIEGGEPTISRGVVTTRRYIHSDTQIFIRNYLKIQT